jgi:hypothetical protein
LKFAPVIVTNTEPCPQTPRRHSLTANLIIAIITIAHCCGAMERRYGRDCWRRHDAQIPVLLRSRCLTNSRHHQPPMYAVCGCRHTTRHAISDMTDITGCCGRAVDCSQCHGCECRTSTKVIPSDFYNIRTWRVCDCRGSHRTRISGSLRWTQVGWVKQINVGDGGGPNWNNQRVTGLATNNHLDSHCGLSCDLGNNKAQL